MMGSIRAVASGAAALALGASVLAAAAPAYADKPVKESFDDTIAPFVVSDVCGFAITVVSHQRGFTITSADGTRTTVHVTEQDVFTANGATLRSKPFTFTIHVLRDAEGQGLHAISTGQIIVVPIEPGVTFRAAGRFDFVTAGADFVVVPESGGSQGQAAFCAALAP
jgi:hypothetical protein